MTIEIVDLPIKHGDVPSFFVCLPEGNNFISPLILQILGEPSRKDKQKPSRWWKTIHYEYVGGIPPQFLAMKYHDLNFIGKIWCLVISYFQTKPSPSYWRSFPGSNAWMARALSLGPQWVSGSKMKVCPVCSWSDFQRYWKRNLGVAQKLDTLIIRWLILNSLNTGWWFGTWLLWLSIYWEGHHPNWLEHSFKRGRLTMVNHQAD